MIFFFSALDCRLPTGSRWDGSGQQMWLVQPERTVIEAKLSCYIERFALSGPCLQHSLCLCSELTPLSGPLGVGVCNPHSRLRKYTFQAKNSPCYDSPVIFHHGTHSYVLLALLQCFWSRDEALTTKRGWKDFRH